MNQGNFHENKKASTTAVDVFQDVQDFMDKYNQKTGLKPHDDIIDFRLRLIFEELQELRDEFFEDSIVEDVSGTQLLVTDEIPAMQVDWQNVTKELSDIIYVVVGMAHTFGLPLKEVFRRVHASNMTKDGSKREDGKVLKGESYEPPTIGDLFDGTETSVPYAS